MPPPRIPVRSLTKHSRSLQPLHFSLPLRASLLSTTTPSTTTPRPTPAHNRAFSTTPIPQSYLIPRREVTFKEPKGRPRLPTGGSTRGTTVVWGDYGIRLRDHDRRISAKKLKIAEETIRRRLRGHAYRIFCRFSASTAVFKKGNEMRMGTGKGGFDHWAARVPVSRVVFEVAGVVHEEIVRDALRLAGSKLPGLWEFVKKGDPPVMGITPLQGDVTAASLLRPRRKIFPGETNTRRIPGTTDGADPKKGVNPSPRG